MSDLKLIAFDAEDLAVLSAHVQDAVLRTDDMAYVKADRRFALVANRFDWVDAVKNEHSEGFRRRRTGLRFERVIDVKLSGLDLRVREKCLELLAISFERKDEPAGYVTLHFAAGAAVRLEVECIEAELKDLGVAWPTRCKPDHPEPSTAKATS